MAAPAVRGARAAHAARALPRHQARPGARGQVNGGPQTHANPWTLSPELFHLHAIEALHGGSHVGPSWKPLRVQAESSANLNHCCSQLRRVRYLHLSMKTHSSSGAFISRHMLHQRAPPAAARKRPSWAPAQEGAPRRGPRAGGGRVQGSGQRLCRGAEAAARAARRREPLRPSPVKQARCM